MANLASEVVVPTPTLLPVSVMRELTSALPFHFDTKLVVSELIVEEPSLPLKVVQSVDVRQPLTDPDAVRHARELAENERPLPMFALVMAPVPLPVRSPPSVDDPVPPLLTDTCPLR